MCIYFDSSPFPASGLLLRCVHLFCVSSSYLRPVVSVLLLRSRAHSRALFLCLLFLGTAACAIVSESGSPFVDGVLPSIRTWVLTSLHKSQGTLAFHLFIQSAGASVLLGKTRVLQAWKPQKAFVWGFFLGSHRYSGTILLS